MNYHNTASKLNASNTENVRIGGGEKGQVLTSDGLGGTTWSGSASDSSPIGAIVFLVIICAIAGFIIDSGLPTSTLIMYGVGIIAVGTAFIWLWYFIQSKIPSFSFGLVFIPVFYFLGWFLYFGHEHVTYGGGLNCLYFSFLAGQLCVWKY